MANCFQHFSDEFVNRSQTYITRLAPVAWIAILSCVSILWLPMSYADDPALQNDDPRNAYFESQVRPILVEHCYECHSQETEQSGGLSLDSKQGWSRGGDSGNAISPGDHQSSLVYRAVAYDDPHLRMPPSGKLTRRQIEALAEWIDQGAFDPRIETVPSTKPSSGLTVENAENHWAYRPRAVPSLPVPQRDLISPGTGEGFAASTIDHFLESARIAKGIQGSEEVERSAILRRLSYDLHGLPPSPEDFEAFLSDDRHDAIERLVDRLLSSPRYAERMARRWLDVARYAESLTLRGFILPNAWRYRDYCIDAFAIDLPYDQFVREQIAGDLLAPQSDDEGLSSTSKSTIEQTQKRYAAITFLLLGNTNLEEQDKKQLEMDIVDEQLDTIGRTFLAQTLGCARCHDHKFDPIPTRDYYAMAAILKQSKVVEHDNVSKWIENPLPLPADESSKYSNLESQIQSVQEEIGKLEQVGKKKSGQTIVNLQSLPGIVVDDTLAIRVGDWTASKSVPEYVGDGYLHDGARDRGAKTITFQPDSLPAGVYEVRLSYSHGDNRATNSLVRVFSAEGEIEKRIDQRQPGPIEGLWVSLGKFRFEQNGQAYLVVSNDGANGHVIADAVQFLPETLTTPDVAVPETGQANDNTVNDEKQVIESKLKELKQRKADLEEQIQRRPRAMGMTPVSKSEPMRIHVRGSVHSLGETVPAGFLNLAKLPNDQWPTDDALPKSDATIPTYAEIDRRSLAEWISHPDHPLTARVYVNRVWYWLMGEGLVRSVDNFGTTGETPTHPELLDYLTSRFIENGWSTKWLVRQIVLSDVYRQRAQRVAMESDPDPENRYLGRSHRKRLDAESIRDTMCLVSGEMDFQMHGRRIPNKLDSDYGYAHKASCRSIYVPAFRNSIPALLRAFDVADPNMVVGQRNRTTVSQQALVMLNDPWVQERAMNTAQRMIDSPGTIREKLDRLGWVLWGRPFRDHERSAAIELLNDSESEPRDRWTILIRSLYASPDFLFLK